MNAQSCLVIAGEASGDLLAAELVRAIRTLTAPTAPFPWTFFGAGGPAMKAAGVELTLDLTAHAVVGVWEVLKHYPHLRRVFYQLVQLACRRQPQMIILVDYPGFNLRFATAIKQYIRSRRGAFWNWHPRIVYYVSPQLWAWHSSRVRQISRDIDLMISIFPFEEAWYAARAPRLRIEFVGHPIMDRYAAQARSLLGSRDERAAQTSTPGEKTSAGQTPETRLVVLLPGSREREIKKHVPLMLAAVQRMASQIAAHFVMVLPNAALVDYVRSVAGFVADVVLQSGGLAELLAKARAAIAASGTVTLECAYFRVPTVVIYRTSWSTYWLGRQVIKVKHIAMPNILADATVYPEFIQTAATPERIAEEALDLFRNEDRRQAIRLKLDEAIASLGPPGACHRAARAIVRLASEIK